MEESVLFVCLGKSWSSKERAALRDCSLAKINGRTPYLYCHRNTIIEEKAIELGIERIYYPERSYQSAFMWAVYQKCINRLDISLVHCYGVEPLLSLAFALRHSPKIPLVFSLFSEVEKSYRGALTSPLLARVDLAIVPVGEMEENIGNMLGIPLRKIVVSGIGVDDCCEGVTLKVGDNKVIGTSVPPHLKSMQTLFPLLNALYVLNQKLDGNFFLHLRYEGEWKSFPLYEEIKQYVLAWRLEEHLIFIDEVPMTQFVKEVDLFVSNETTNKLDDYLITSLLGGTPILGPRCGANYELIESYNHIGESYRPGDSREVLNKCEKIFNKIDEYREGVRRAQSVISGIHGVQNYMRTISALYNRVIGKRARLFLRVR